MARPAPGGHIAALDGLRGIAAWLVVASHTNNAVTENWWWFQGAGAAGVMVFFVLSGFLMGYLYSELPFTGRNLSKYGSRRFDRVIPLYLCVVLFSIFNFYYRLPVHSYAVRPDNIWEHLLLIEGQNVLWTIPVETSFYFLFVGLWFLKSRSTGLYGAACLALVAGAIATRFAPLPTGHTLPLFITFFIAGLFAADLFNSKAVQRDPATNIPGLILGLACVALLIPGVFIKTFGFGAGGYRALLPVILAFTAVSATAYSHAAQSVLGSALMRFQGKISYSVYLLHPIVLYTLRRHTDLDNWSLLGAVVAVTLIVATVSYYTLEQIKPFKWLGLARSAIQPRRPAEVREPRGNVINVTPDLLHTHGKTAQ